jgi:hypothetical protein
MAKRAINNQPIRVFNNVLSFEVSGKSILPISWHLFNLRIRVTTTIFGKMLKRSQIIEE